MDFSKLLEPFIGSEKVAGLLNLMLDIVAALEYARYFFLYAGVVVFVWGIRGLITFKRANSQTTGQSVALKLIFGPLLSQVGLLLGDATKSIWADGTPESATGYVALARGAEAGSPFLAIIYACLALLVALGWIFAGKAVYGFATLGDQQDRHGALWKNVYIALGAILATNISLVAMDIMASASGTTISTGGF